MILLMRDRLGPGAAIHQGEKRAIAAMRWMERRHTLGRLTIQ